MAGNTASTDDDGIEILQVYSKEISKRMLETVKARSGDSAAAPEPAQATDEPLKALDEVDAGSNAPQQSEKTEPLCCGFVHIGSKRDQGNELCWQIYQRCSFCC